MSVKTTAVSIFAVVLLLLALPQIAFPQAQVRDSAPVAPMPATAVPSATSSSNVVSASSTNQAFQIQQLQQEVLELRGLLEEMSFELKRLKQQRLDDYLDLDKRLAELSSTTPSNNLGRSNSSSSNVGSLIPGANNSATSLEDEKRLYRKAIDQLLNQQDYDAALSNFGQYLDMYSMGAYAADVYSWQGQIYLIQNKLTKAEQSFKTLVKTYPSHQKTPDAKYKLATIYFDQGKKSEAKQLLDVVAISNSDAARLAKAFLSDKF